MSERISRACARMALMALGAALLLVVVAAPAAAQPAEPTASLSQLRSAIAEAPGGVLTGYFRTVLRGSTIQTITCDILAVTGAPTDFPDPNVELIVFESDDAEIVRIGGIASGMSGSPVFATIDGVDKLVGAVAYGDMFTLGGMGAATPIDAMSAVEALGQPTVRTLSKPLATATGVKSGVAVTSDVLTGYSTSATGMLALKPLSSLYIGGISPKSSAYRAYSRFAESRGFSVVPLAAELGTGNESYETTVEGGSAAAVLAARGDLWVGALGTVTYENGGNAMLFGHPMTGEGETDLYLHNAWIDTTWRSSYFPYKLGVPGKPRGSVTQDRGAGVLGVVGAAPAEVVVSGRAFREDTAKEATAGVGIPSFVANSSSYMWYGITPFAASVAGSKLYPTWPAPGSARTVTRVVVSDGTTETVIERSNYWDSDYDIPLAAANDVDLIVSQVLSVRQAGYFPAEVLSVSSEATFSAERSAASIVGIDVPNSFKPGDNRVRVSLLRRGVLATQTVDVTLTVPAGAPLDGQIVASVGSFEQPVEVETGASEGEIVYMDEPGTYEDRRTLAEAIADINDTPTNNVLSVSYVGREAQEPAAEASVDTTWTLGGYASKAVYKVNAYVEPRTIVAGQAVFLEGYLEGATDGTVTVYAKSAGSASERVLASEALTSGGPEGEGGNFLFLLGPLYKNTTLRVAYSGDEGSAPSETSRSIAVRAYVSMTSSRRIVSRGSYVTLTGYVAPKDFGGKVYFERYTSTGWRRISSYISAPTGKVSFRYRPPAGRVKIRARTMGSPTNAVGASATYTLTVR